VTAAKSYLDECFRVGTAPRVDELARRLELHPSVLSRTFHSATGRRLSSVLKAAQIVEAKRLLATTTLPMGDVARRAGFGTPNTLFRQFRQHVGVTPDRYRRAR
jgi:AraC-like DNA-binding protein